MTKKEIFSEKAPEPIGPYSQAIETNNMLYLSGQIAINQSTGELLTDDLEVETHQVMKNIGYMLDEAGYTFDHIIKTSIFLSDMSLFAQVNEIYASYLKAPYPARETVAVAGLPKGVNVEISLIASK